LAWLRLNAAEKGDNGHKGLHRTARLIHALVAAGSDEQAARDAIHYLLKAGCILAEHLRTESVSDDDLVMLTPAGHVHLELAHRDIHYLAACAEDTWLADSSLASEVHRRITLQPYWKALGYGITLDTAGDFANYLQKQQQNSVTTPAAFLTDEEQPKIDINVELLQRAIGIEAEKFYSNRR
jgi:hypothetical protein